MARLSVANENAILNALLRNVSFTGPATVYVSLHTGDPGQTGANEVSGGSYARQAAAWSAASGGSIANSGALSFTMPASTITHWGVWSAASGGTYQHGGVLASSQTFGSGDTASIAIGALVATLS